MFLTSVIKNYCPHVASVHWCLWGFFHGCLKAPTTAFQSGWGLDSDWIISAPWSFFLCCSIVDLLLFLGHCPLAWPNLVQALSIAQMSSHLTPEYSVTARCPGWLKQNKPSCADSCRCALFSFHQRNVTIMVKHLLIWFVCWKDIVPKELCGGFFPLRCNFAKLSHAAVFL